MSAVYTIPVLVAFLMEELLPPSAKVRARARSAATIFWTPFERSLTASLSADVLDAARG
jgi:hypothetical protein